MTELDENGFLGEPASVWSRAFQEAHSPLLERCEQLNQDVHSLLYSVKVHIEDGREVIAALLLSRAIEFYQAAILLLGKGMQTAAKTVIRGLLESVFSLRAVTQDEETLKAYIEDDHIQRLKMINKARNNDAPNLELLKKAATDKIHDAIKQTIKEKEITHLSTEELSKRANMHDWYLTVYSMLSKAVHSQVRDLERQLQTTDQKEIAGLKYGPSDSEVRNLLANASLCLVIGLAAAAAVFECDLRELCEGHENFMKNVIDELNAQQPLDDA